MIQSKTDQANSAPNEASPRKGDDGEAMAVSENQPSSVPLTARQKRSDTEPVMPKDAGWYVAVVRCNCEKRIADSIKLFFEDENIWFEYWVPMQKVVYVDKRTKKRRTKEKVFLATFIFCHVSKRRLDDIRFRPDVYKMLTMPGQREIYRISDQELLDYRRIVENPDIPAVPCTGPLKKGQKVRIKEGHMAGLEAYVQRVSGKKVVIGNGIQFVCGAIITIDRAFLETVSDA